MPPKAADQKRKRGRPSNASKSADALPGSPEAVETEEAPAPGRRGRPSKRKDTEVSSPAEEPKTKKRGRPPREAAIEAEVEEANEEEPEPAQAKPKSKKANKSKSKDNEEAADGNGSTSRREKPASRGKPGRKPRKEANEEAQDEEEAGTSNSAKKKRGRQPEKPTEEEEPEEAVSPEPVPKKKRGRPSLDKEPAAEEPSQAAEEDAAPKKRGRKPKEKVSEVEEPAPEEEAEAEAAPKKKRGRKANVTVEEVDEPPAEEDSAAVKRKRGRPSAQAEPEAQEVSQSEPKEGRRRKGKQPVPAAETTAENPTKKRRKKGEEEEEASPDTQRRRAGRPRTSDAASPQNETSQARKSKKRPTEDDAVEASAPAKKRRRRTSDEIQQEKQEQQQQQPKTEASKTVRRAPKHRHIAARVRQIPRSVIEEKWSPLKNPSLSIVSNLLRLAERPVLQRIPGSEKRRDQAASALHLITNRLLKKLSRGLPFPPASAPPTGGKNGSRKLLETDGGRVEELNFERVIEGVAALERQLDPLLHAVDLLKTEKEREEMALEEDYETLRTLEANARSEARNFKDSLRKTHVLVPEATKPGTASAAAENTVKHGEQDLNFIVSEEGVGSGTPLFKDLEDDELRGLAGQVGSHMESMRANLQQIDGVVPQIVKSRAALQDVLFKHLDQQSFENVLFG
ncbi:hypothetical protein CMEL01_03241 [Colletotrichum melonis]|uniref:Kinetochore protein fta7 n=1 Tax=Colletotrichum melonis TaxID=1209925 RepID=A0AAI9UKN4_9PEZI|nr:hypothetical protein CMEL01_03241 [Colletotrichum melonis]